MRRSRRGGHGGLEFGGSGEDSFVAVVVTKLTGALLFILLLTMVIMALLPKAVDLPPSESGTPTAATDAVPLTITTPETLPEAIAGRPYAVALAASGGRGTHRWSIEGTLPDGLTFDGDSGQLRGTPRSGTPKPASLVLHVSDDHDRVSQPSRLVVFETDRPLSTPSSWKPGIPPIPWRLWLEHGFGFLLLWLVHLVGMNALAGLRRHALAAVDEASPDAPEEDRAISRRFGLYRGFVRLCTLGMTVGLALWLWAQRG